MTPWVLFSVTLILLLISCVYNYRFARIILNIEDSIAECLDKLDEKYDSISKILEIPLFYDSPQIRSVIKDIQESRDSLLFVANKIATVEELPDGQKEEI